MSDELNVWEERIRFMGMMLVLLEEWDQDARYPTIFRARCRKAGADLEVILSQLIDLEGRGLLPERIHVLPDPPGTE